MEGKRFGVGLAAGLLFALVLVFGSTLVAAPSGTFSAGLTKQFTPGSTTTGSATSTTATNTSVPGYLVALTSATRTSSSPPPHQVAGNLSSFVSANSAAANASPPLPFSSALATLNQLPSSSRALLLAPIAVAALLGVLIHRASSRDRVEPEED